MTKICVTCGAEFEPKPNMKDRQKYCSKDCQCLSANARRRAKRAGLSSVGKLTTCKICGREYIKEYSMHVYCSDVCKTIGFKQNQKRGREKAKAIHAGRDRSRIKRGCREYTKICLECGKTFTTWRPNKGTCSDECKVAHQKARAKYRDRHRTRNPEEEHRRYIIRKYGSEEAHMAHLEETERKKQARMERTKARKEREREERLAANFREGECVVCGKTFTTYNPQQKTCCSECGKKLSYARKQKRIPKAQMVDKDITLEALYRRDSGVCYLCGGQCDWNDITVERNCVGRNYPSIDHIIPVSRGGLHAWNNVRLAHFGCNSEKADSLIPDAEKLIPKNAYQFKRNVRPRKRKTLQLAKDMTLIAEYESTAEAERITGIAQKKIQDCARGRHKTSGGYVWRYAQ